jgi:hypothetical protein
MVLHCSALFSVVHKEDCFLPLPLALLLVSILWQREAEPLSFCNSSPPLTMAVAVLTDTHSSFEKVSNTLDLEVCLP